MNQTATKSSPSPRPTWLRIAINQGLVFLIAALGFISLWTLRDLQQLGTLGWTGIISMGFVGIWRWSWVGFHLLRAWFYEYIVFPRWRRRANKIALEELPPVCLLVPTYKEKPWITERVFRSIGLEARSLGRPVTIVTVSSGAEEDRAIVAALRLGDPELSSVRVVHAEDPGDGKRKALAEGLRAIAGLNLPEDTIVALMDGDSEFTPGTLRQTLPFFKLFPKLGALTTDETPYVVGSYLFSEWFHLRFAQRHYMMCSISLSRRVLCLTGRFSLYRAEAALAPDFAAQLENDTLDDWLWGRFKFLSGDDKTTWYWMLRHRDYDLLYIPDVLIYSIESISGSLWKRVYQNMRRWFGNMLRNGNRAMALGPRRLGAFVYLCLLDQRISMWTSLIAPSLLLIALVGGQWVAAGILCSWLAMSRSLTLVWIFWKRESHLKPIHLPILLLSQWSSALIKIWTLMNLPKQRWFNRGDRKLGVEGQRWLQILKSNTSNFLLWSQSFTFGLVLFTLLGLLDPVRDSVAWWQVGQAFSTIPTVNTVEAIDYGVIPNDGLDDALSLQELLQSLPDGETVRVSLPAGELDFFQPLRISRSHTILQGQGIGRTIIRSAISVPVRAVLVVEPPSNVETTTASFNFRDRLRDVEIEDLTLRPRGDRSISDNSSAILLKNVLRPHLRRLAIDPGYHQALVLDMVENVTLEYLNLASYEANERLVQVNSDPDLS